MTTAFPRRIVNAEEESRRFFEAIQDPDAAQCELLREILDDNARAEYVKKHGLASVRTMADYAKAAPLASYDDIRADIERMMDGEADVLSAGVPIFFARTSGTSSQPKHYPFSERVIREVGRIAGVNIHNLETLAPGCTEHALVFFACFQEDSTSTGIPIGPTSGFSRTYLDHSYFRYVPEEVFNLDDYDARYYALLRMALQKPLRQLTAFNPSTLLTFLGKLEAFGPSLVADLRDGTISRGPAAAREVAAKMDLRQNVERAAALEKALGSESPLVASAIWPELQMLETWKGGMCALYLPEVQERFPGCRVRSMVSGATEGVMFVALDENWTGGIPVLRTTVMEFFEVDRAEPIPMQELTIGHGYQVALTNQRGLYRHRMDDVFVVDDKFQDLPVMSFSHRNELTSSLTGEKLTENQIITALSEAKANASIAVRNSIVGPEWGEPPGYLLLVELGGAATDSQLETYVAAFERALSAANSEYEYKRATSRLKPPELAVLRAGEFDRLRKLKAKGRSDAQVKIPTLSRDLINRDELAIDRVISIPSSVLVS